MEGMRAATAGFAVAVDLVGPAVLAR